MAKVSQKTADRWPEGAIVYHIYPRSLKDANRDGVGDLKGIIDSLDYIHDLGANAIWLSPFYPSPMADFGYDISDYCDVDPIFGTIADFKKLLDRSHAKNMKVIVDLVPNHTSDEHEWFKQSEKSISNKYADWYVWRDPRPDVYEKQPPNNWLDALSGDSAWEWNEKRGQYFLHSFNVRQPDLNWSNPEVREAIKDVMRYWLDQGVDGFRIDAVYWMAKEPLLSDDSPNPDYVPGEDLKYDAVMHDNSRGWPAVYAYLSEMAEVLKEDKFKGRSPFMITEAYPERHNPLSAYLAFYVGMDPKVAAPFNFEGTSLKWQAGEWRRFLHAFHTALKQFSPHCVASYAFGNHDIPRLISRMGEKVARSIAVMQLTLPGMIFVYYGEELGMKDVKIPPEFVQDPAARGDPKYGIGRDPQRTPMQWNDQKNAGFSNADKTWLPIDAKYKVQNVEAQSKDPDSFLNLYRLLAGIRNKSKALRTGELNIIDVGHPDVLAYTRENGDKDKYLIMVNFSGQKANAFLGAFPHTLIVSSDPRTKLAVGVGQVELGPYEAVLFSLAA